jgi:hypothetical protein
MTSDPADRADLHERALQSAQRILSADAAERHALGALDARRELGVRSDIALATAAYTSASSAFGRTNPHALEQMQAAWAEFSDLEQTPPGVALMLEMAASHVDEQDDVAALQWLERLLPVAERLDLLPSTASALQRKSGILFRLVRPREALILQRGVHELAVVNDLERTHLNTRTVLTFYEQFDDPRAGLAMAREGLEIAARLGSVRYGFGMVGNAVSCAIRIGEWDWAAAILDEWLANDTIGDFHLELYLDRTVLTALRGGDGGGDLDAARRLLPGTTDPQYRSYAHWAQAWMALTSGAMAEAAREAEAAAQVTNYFEPITLPLATRAALWAGDAVAAASLVERMDRSVIRGHATELDRTTLRAGIAALQGRRQDAIAGYRDALRGWQGSGLAFEEALAGLDMAILLAPTEREMGEAPGIVEGARDVFARLRARPFMARLDQVPIDGLDPAQATTSTSTAGAATPSISD